MRLRFLFAFLLLSPLAAFSQSYFGVNGWCTVGAQATVTQGLSSAGTKPISGGTFSQNSGVLASYPKCTITVYATGTTSISPIYSNAAGNVLANPFTGNVDGSFLFFAVAGCYDIVTSSGITTGSTMPQNKTYTDVCVGGTGGGGTVGPGTVNQIAKFVSVNNVGNSSGFDDGIGFVQWPIGLTSMGSAYGHLYPNSPNGTTANYLACIDSTITSVAEVTTCPASTTKALGIVHAGTAGTTGNAQIASMGFDSCVFDNQTVIGDYAGPSTSVAGQCTDLGGTRPASFQGVGRVTTLNNGAGTASILDLGPWDLFSPGSTGFGQCTSNFANAYFSGGNLLCDASVTDDGGGNLTAKSIGLTDPTQAGFYYLKQGTQPAAAPLNTRMDTVPSSVTTYTVIHPGVPCTVANQTEVVQSTTTDSNGNTVEIMTCGNTGGSAAPQASNPSAPTLTTNGTPGTTSYSYAIVGCEDGPTCAYHSAASSATAIATGAATLTSVNSITLKTYADTLYGYRCYNVYRTASAGTPSSTGLIANCVWKSFIDTGLAGDGTTAPNTNTTALDANGLTNPLPGCNKIPGSPYGIDGVPCTPNAMDEEFSWGNGTWAPGDANNPFWTWVNQNSATATLTNGMMVLTSPSRSGSDNLNCLVQAAPSTPYTFVTVLYNQTLFTFPVTDFYFGFRESATTKMVMEGNDASNEKYIVARWNSPTSLSILSANGAAGYFSHFGYVYLKIQNDGTNLNFSTSSDGIQYIQQYTETKNAFFTTAPDQVGFCIDNKGGVSYMDIDYFRRTQ